jgi:hypothetical protein
MKIETEVEEEGLSFLGFSLVPHGDDGRKKKGMEGRNWFAEIFIRDLITY